MSNTPNPNLFNSQPPPVGTYIIENRSNSLQPQQQNSIFGARNQLFGNPFSSPQQQRSQMPFNIHPNPAQQVRQSQNSQNNANQPANQMQNDQNQQQNNQQNQNLTSNQQSNVQQNQIQDPNQQQNQNQGLNQQQNIQQIQNQAPIQQPNVVQQANPQQQNAQQLADFILFLQQCTDIERNQILTLLSNQQNNAQQQPNQAQNSNQQNANQNVVPQNANNVLQNQNNVPQQQQNVQQVNIPGPNINQNQQIINQNQQIQPVQQNPQNNQAIQIRNFGQCPQIALANSIPIKPFAFEQSRSDQFSITMNPGFQSQILGIAPHEFQRDLTAQVKGQMSGILYKADTVSQNNNNIDNLSVLNIDFNKKSKNSILKDEFFHCLNIIQGQIKYICREQIVSALALAIQDYQSLINKFVSNKMFDLDQLGGLITDSQNNCYKFVRVDNSFSQNDIISQNVFHNGFEQYLTMQGFNQYLVYIIDGNEFNFVVLKKQNQNWFLINKKNILYQITDSYINSNIIPQATAMNYNELANNIFGSQNILFGLQLMDINDQTENQFKQLILKKFYDGLNYQQSNTKWKHFYTHQGQSALAESVIFKKQPPQKNENHKNNTEKKQKKKMKKSKKSFKNSYNKKDSKIKEKEKKKGKNHGKNHRRRSRSRIKSKRQSSSSSGSSNSSSASSKKQQ